MLWRIAVGRVDQHIRIDEEHLPNFHRLIESCAVGDVDAGATARKARQRREVWALPWRLEQQPKRGLDELRHRSPLPGGLAFEAFHEGIVYVECRLHGMANHIQGTAVWQSQPARTIHRRGRCLTARGNARNRDRDAARATCFAIDESKKHTLYGRESNILRQRRLQMTIPGNLT